LSFSQDQSTAGINYVTFNPLEVYPINTFGAINTDNDPLTLVDQSPDSQNVVTDDGPGLTGRKGFVSLSTESLKAMWVLPHSSGTRYKIGQSSGTLKASTDGLTYNITISTVDQQYTTAGAVLGDAFYFSDLTNGLKKATFSGSAATVVSVSTSLRFSMLISAQGRLMGAGIPGSERILRISEYTPNESNFTLVANSSDTMPAALTISGALDEPISGLYASYRGYPVVFKPHSFGIIYGTRRSNFAYQKYSDQVGTAYPESVQDCDGILRWLGPSRTIWEFNGVGWRDISNDPKDRKRISSFMATVAQGTANTRSWSVTTQSDFAQGNSLQVSTAISAGSVMLSTWTGVDTAAVDFASGTSVNTDTTTVSGQVQLSVNNADCPDNSLESQTWAHSGSGWLGDTSAYVGGEGGVSPQNGSVMARLCYTEGGFGSGIWSYTIQDSGGGTLASGSVTTVNSTSWAQRSIDVSAYKGRHIKIKISVFYTGLHTYAGNFTTPLFLGGGDTFSFYIAQGDSGPEYALLDYATGGASTISSGTFVSRTFDTAFSSAAWLPSTFTATTNGHAITVRTQSSPDGGAWGSSETWTSGSAPANGWNRYFRYQVEFSTTSSGTALPTFADASPLARASTGSWVGPSIQTTGMSAHDIFAAAETLNGGAIVYAIYTDSDSTKLLDATTNKPIAGSYLSSATVTNGAIPSLSTAAYVFGTANFSISLATQNPTLDDQVYAWKTGSTLRVASAFPNKRYWLAVSVSSTANNRVLVYDKNEDWQLYSGINAAAMVFDSELYFSNSAGVFQGETGYNDNGAAITSYYKTPTLALGGLDNWVKFHSLRLTTAQSDSTLSTTYQFNGNGTDYSFGDYAMNQATGYQNFKLPFPASEVSQGKFLNLKFSVTGTSYWRILNASIYHRKDALPR
jgi:hypothetical protein